MGFNKHGSESHGEHVHRRMQIVYAGKMRERQIYMQDLKQFRKQTVKNRFAAVKKAIGPIWYHALSVPQTLALDSLEFSIYQDLLEGLPVKTAKIMRELGIFPRPNRDELMSCLHIGHKDPKVMLAQLFTIRYGHNIDSKRASYDLNAKLILSSILYLGLDNLIILLKERFRPDTQEKERKEKPKAKEEPPLASPYLQKMVAALYLPTKKKRRPPPPLPNLEDLNEPYEEEPPIPKPPPLPPPPPPPKKRLPRSYCDKLANVMDIQPHCSVTSLTVKTVTRTSHRRLRGSNICVAEVKKTYGLQLTNRKKSTRRRKPVPPSTGMWNSQYTINGVYQIGGKSIFVLGSVSVLPALGELIHGGYGYLDGKCINVHCGFRARPPPPKPDPCDCLKKWQDKVFQYVKSSKCYCAHYYDFGNEGTFGPEELPFFEKPTPHKPFSFNYDTIYDLDSKHIHIQKEFKSIWDTESMLHVDDGTVKDKKDKKKKKKRSSTTCLGQNPKPEDYLQCALRLMRKQNVAARLPDIHLVPELKEWMRYRLYGRYSAKQKAQMNCTSTHFWQFFSVLASKSYGHVAPPADTNFAGHTNWHLKKELAKKFKNYSHKYRLALFRSLAHVNNQLWPSMCQAQFPDKKFREIFFTYLSARVEDLHLMNPYSPREAEQRKFVLANKRYSCLPAGVELDN